MTHDFMIAHSEYLDQFHVYMLTYILAAILEQPLVERGHVPFNLEFCLAYH